MDSVIGSSYSTAIVTWCILLLAWLFERYLPINSSIDPIAFFRFVCQRMATRVLPAEQQTQQHFISGTLAAMLLLVPIIVIVWLVSEFASFPDIFDGIIMYLCLQFSQQTRLMTTVNKALNGQKKQLAKDLIAPSLLRDTAPLSPVGINKANIEMYVLRSAYQQAVVMFWFILLGPIAALSYRLIFEISQSWNVKLVQFSKFGWCSHLLCTAAQWLPARLFALILFIVNLPPNFFGRARQLLTAKAVFGSTGGFVLASLASALNKTLSGPVFYKGDKIRRSKYQMTAEPNFSDAAKTMQLCLRATIALLWLLLVFSWGLNA